MSTEFYELIARDLEAFERIWKERASERSAREERFGCHADAVLLTQPRPLSGRIALIVRFPAAGIDNTIGAAAILFLCVT